MNAGSAITAAGYGVGALVFFLAARQRRLTTEGMRHVALAGLCGGVLGAKLTEWALGHWQALASHPEAMLDPRLGGRTIIGGVLAGWLAVEIAKWRLGIRRSTGDLFALALPAGEAVGRIGCFFNGCCCGVPSRVPWAVYQHGAWRHPAQIYAALLAAAIFGTLFTLRDRMLHEGDLYKLYLALYGAGRFALEFLRERALAFGGLSLAQWTCLEISIVASVALSRSRRRTAVALRAEVERDAIGT